MTPSHCADQASIPPPSYHHTMAAGLHLDALTLVSHVHLLALCRVAVHLAHEQCPPPLPAGLGLRALWRLSYQELPDWLCAWTALALACGLPLGPDGRLRVPSNAQQSKRLRMAGAPASEMLFVVRAGLWMGLTRARDLIIDSAPILVWRRADSDAAFGHAPAHHPRPLLLGYRLHTLLCRGTGLPLLFLSRRPTYMMRLLPVPFWSGPCGCFGYGRWLFGWMPATGGSS